MSAETLGASAVSTPSASIGAETSAGGVANGFATGADSLQSFSSLSSFGEWDAPTSIVREFSLPESLKSELETVVEPIVGDFELADITGEKVITQPETILRRTTVEPQISLAAFIETPIIDLPKPEAGPVSSILTRSELENLTQQAEVVPKTTIDILPQTNFAFEESFKSDSTENEVSQPEPSLITEPRAADQEIGTLMSEILTMGAISDAETSTSATEDDAANQQALKTAIAYLKTAGFTKEEESQWQQKLESAAATQTNKLTEVQTQIQETVQSLPKNQLDFGGNEPQEDFEGGDDGDGDEEEMQQNKKIIKPKPELWDWYTLDKKTQHAIDVIVRRNKVARNIANSAYKSADPRTAVEKRLMEVDTLQLQELIQIASGDLEMPPIGWKVSSNLTFVENSPKEVAKTVVETVEKTPSFEKVIYIKDLKRVKQEELPQSAQPVVSQGAEAMVHVTRRGWKKVPKLPIKHIWEAEKVKEAA